MSEKPTYEELEKRVKALEKEAKKRILLEQKIKESEEKYKILTEESLLGLALISEKGNYKYLNPKFSEMFGYTLEDISTGKDWLRRAYPNKEQKQIIQFRILQTCRFFQQTAQGEMLKLQIQNNQKVMRIFYKIQSHTAAVICQL